MTKTATKPAAPELFAGEQTVMPPEKPAAESAPKPTRKAAVVQKLPAVQAPPEPKNMLAVIASAAADPRVDVAKMKELLAMQLQIEEARHVRQFNRALRLAQNEIPRIVKDKKTDKARFASLENVSRNLDPVTRKHGFSMSFGTADSPLPNHYRIVCDLSHSDPENEDEGGHVRRYFIDLQSDEVGAKGNANKTPIQGVASTMSYGRRYLKLMIFDITVVDQDVDGNKHKPDTTQDQGDVILISKEQLKALAGAITWCGVGERVVCETYKIEKIPDLPASRFADAMTACRNYAANNPNKVKGTIDG